MDVKYVLDESKIEVEKDKNITDGYECPQCGKRCETCNCKH